MLGFPQLHSSSILQDRSASPKCGAELSRSHDRIFLACGWFAFQDAKATGLPVSGKELVEDSRGANKDA
jgi:hypothetical protein